MFSHSLGVLLDDAGRGDDRGARPRGGHGKPAILGRRTTVVMAALGIAAILYGTLMPFKIDPGASLAWRLDVNRPAAGDTLANVAIYVPVGVCLRLLFRRRGGRAGIEWALSLAGAAGLSYLSEVLQGVLVLRVPSLTDSACNVAGAAMGIGLAPTVQRMLRNAHAWVYRALRREPCTVGAAGGGTVHDGQPARLIRVLMVLIVLGGLSLVIGSLARRATWQPAPRGATPTWIPMVASFDWSWDRLLGEYAAGFCQYGALAGLLVLGRRSRGCVPGPAVVCALTVGMSAAMEAAAWTSGRHVDSAMIGFGLIAAVTVIRIDRAVFGGDPPVPQPIAR